MLATLGNLSGENDDELEYLLPPCTAVRVTDKFQDSDGKWIAVEIIPDNQQKSVGLPSILL